MKMHLCLVSAELSANLIPIFMDKPALIGLIVSKSMQKNAERFDTLLKQQGFSTILFQDAPSAGIDEIITYAEELQQDLAQFCPEYEVILNCTGGTKFMSLGFINAFQDTATNIIYTDTANNQIEYLPTQEGDIPAPRPLNSVFTIPLYLQVNRVPYLNAMSDNESWRETVQQRRKISHDLAHNAHQLSFLFSTLNLFSSHARDDNNKCLIPQNQLKKDQTHYREKPYASILNWLNRLQQINLIHWDKENYAVEFTSYDAACYLGGFWLEEYLFDVIEALNPDDVRNGVRIQQTDRCQQTNELDILVVHNNRLLAIECKTLRMGTEYSNDNEILYKLHSVSDDLRGLYGTTLLVSAQRPSDKVIQRAKCKRIALISPNELPLLAGKIKQWMETGRFLLEKH
jgi:hypothetical protein